MSWRCVAVRFLKMNWRRVAVSFLVVVVGALAFFNPWKPWVDFVKSDKFLAYWALFSLWGLAVYLSVAHWVPGTVWRRLEKADYDIMSKDVLRTKLRGSLPAVAILTSFGIGFVVLTISTLVRVPNLPSVEFNVLCTVAFLFVMAVICLFVTLEAYDTAANPGLTTSGEISAIYTLVWWFYTLGMYFLIFGLLMGAYFIAPLITIVGVFVFIVLFTSYLYILRLRGR